MIHEGQEFARSKVIEPTEFVEETDAGTIDHNSYNKDNNTNYLNFQHAELNRELVDYYKGLIKLRKTHDVFSKADYNNYSFQNFKKNEFALAYNIKHKNKNYYVAFNANPSISQEVELPSGWWEILADENSVGSEKVKSINGTITLNPSTGIVLKQK